MKNRTQLFSITVLLLVAAAAAPGQEKPEVPPPAQARGNMDRRIVLGPTMFGRSRMVPRVRDTHEKGRIGFQVGDTTDELPPLIC